MEINQLMYFIEVAEREHMSNAAEYLNVAQSAISRQISNLEDELGVLLFERAGRNVKILPAGEILLSHAKTIIEQLDQTKKHLAEYTSPDSGIINIGFPTSLATTLLPNIINAFSKEYPKIKFHLRQGSYLFLHESIKSRKFNIAFLGPVILDDPSIKGDILFVEKLLLLVPRSHRLVEREHVSMKTLRKEEFILFPKGYILEKMVTDACHNEGFEPTITGEGEDLDAIKGMVAAGIGITVLPESAITGHENIFLKCIPIQNPLIERSVGMITPQKRNLTPSEKVFYQFVLDYFK